MAEGFPYIKLKEKEKTWGLFMEELARYVVAGEKGQQVHYLCGIATFGGGFERQWLGSIFLMGGAEWCSMSHTLFGKKSGPR